MNVMKQRCAKDNGHRSDEATDDHNKESKNNQCISCHHNTQSKATVYLGTSHLSKNGLSKVQWIPYEQALCSDCVRMNNDSDTYKILLYLALQACWISLFLHGPSPIGLAGALVASVAIYKIIQYVADSIWRRTHNESEKEPAWMCCRPTYEEMSSDTLKHIVGSELLNRGYLVESLSEFRRHISS